MRIPQIQQESYLKNHEKQQEQPERLDFIAN